eukprot:3462042-Prymnesium_polylepis.1
MVERLEFIAHKEGVLCPKDTLAALTRESEGDMRRAIQMLQSLHQLSGGEIAPGAVLDITGAVPADRLTAVMD